MRDIMYEPGLIIGLVGPMWSYKTNKLKGHIERFALSELDVGVFQPKTNTRSERGLAGAQQVEKAAHILEMVRERSHVVVLDETQFFDAEIVDVVDVLARKRGKMVLFAGLDLDSRGKGFGPMPELLAITMDVVKCTAICMKCKKPGACRSQRIVKSDAIILVGDKESYEARCLSCFEPDL